MAYIKEVIFTAIVCGIITGLSAIGKSSVTKYVKFVASIAFLYILLSPFIDGTISYESITNELSSIVDTTSTEENSTLSDSNIDVISNEICKAAISSAAEEFGVSDDTFSISIVLSKSEKNELAIQEATVFVKDEFVNIEKAAIKQYFGKILNCKVEVK